MTMKCTQCQKEFNFTKKDWEFYKKINIAEPDICSQCRDMIRMAWRNERFLYPRQCEKTGKKIISIVSPQSGYKVFSNEVWYGDDWQALDYGRDYDFSRGFFEQLAELEKAVPRLYAFVIQNINSEYCNGAQQDKNCYLLFVSDRNEDCYYVYGIFDCKDTADCLNLESSELCYECIDSLDCYHCFYGYNLRSCRDVHVSYDCSGCSDCFGCYNLRNQKFCWFNKQLSEGEYKNKISEIDFSSREKLKSLEKEFREVYQKAIHQYAFLPKCRESTGDFLKQCRRSTNCYESYDMIDCHNVQVGVDSRWCWDCYVAVDQAELCYECVSIVNSYNCHFCIATWHNRDCQYCDNCVSCSDCFACVGLKHKKFCIFNKQYSEKEYQELRDKIIKQAKERDEYGKFMPPEHSPFAYNETIAHDLNPLTKEEVEKKGWWWQDNLPGTFGQETLKEIPDNIKDVDDNIIKEVLVCSKCKKNYKVIPQELKFYRKQNLPIPTECFDCRHLRRWQMRNPRKLWHRQCMCEKEGHGHQGRCQNEFETTYPPRPTSEVASPSLGGRVEAGSPKREEVIYCEECYQKEIY